VFTDERAEQVHRRWTVVDPAEQAERIVPALVMGSVLLKGRMRIAVDGPIVSVASS